MHTDKLQVRNKEGKWAELEGQARVDAINKLKSLKSISIAQEDPKTSKVLSKFKAEKDLLSKQVVGSIKGSTMPGGSANRIPGRDGSNPQGSVATRFVAETMFNYTKCRRS